MTERLIDVAARATLRARTTALLRRSVLVARAVNGVTRSQRPVAVRCFLLGRRRVEPLAVVDAGLGRVRAASIAGTSMS